MSMNKSISVHVGIGRPTLTGLAHFMRFRRAATLGAVLAVAALSHGVTAKAYPFFDEAAVAGAVSATLPASWARSAATPMRNGIVYLDETSIRHAMSPPLPAIWMQTSLTGPTTTSTACPALLQHSFNLLQTGTPQSLCRYHGNVVLVVNTASKCGYTDQYGSLE
ncbi:MAG: hypothetical protein ABIO63_13905, partial [Casimicrobiaceae bacterium]